MKAARFYDKLDIRIDDIAVPEPKDGEVLVNIAWGGICGTVSATISTKEHVNLFFAR